MLLSVLEIINLSIFRFKNFSPDWQTDKQTDRRTKPIAWRFNSSVRRVINAKAPSSSLWHPILSSVCEIHQMQTKSSSKFGPSFSTIYYLVPKMPMPWEIPRYGINYWKVTLSLDDKESFIWRNEYAAISAVLTIKISDDGRKQTIKVTWYT